MRQATAWTPSSTFPPRRSGPRNACGGRSDWRSSSGACGAWTMPGFATSRNCRSGTARRLAWCEPCGERLATLTAVERDLLATATSDVTGVESVLGDVAARLVIAVRSGWAAIAEWRGLVPIDGLAPAVVRAGPDRSQ